jgi:hypothetical protein
MGPPQLSVSWLPQFTRWHFFQPSNLQSFAGVQIDLNALITSVTPLVPWLRFSEFAEQYGAHFHPELISVFLMASKNLSSRFH